MGLSVVIVGGPGATRTPDPQIRSVQGVEVWWGFADSPCPFPAISNYNEVGVRVLKPSFQANSSLGQVI